MSHLVLPVQLKPNDHIKVNYYDRPQVAEVQAVSRSQNGWVIAVKINKCSEKINVGNDAWVEVV